MIFRQIREYLLLTRRERNGLLVLVFILLATVCLDYLVPYLVPAEDIDAPGLMAEAVNPPERSFPLNEKDGIKIPGKFDPNKVTKEELDKMGIPKGLAFTWSRYLEKGGVFRKRDDVRKLYGMQDDLYEKLKDSMIVQANIAKSVSGTGKSVHDSKILMAEVSKDPETRAAYSEKKAVTLIEINKADSAQLESLPGIGPVLASRILKYRNLVGGYYSKRQLMDIYGLTEELWQKASPCLSVDSTVLKKLEVNFLSLSELGRHPYIGYRTARKIIRKRDLSGKFNRKEELTDFFSADSLRRVWPYLSTGSD